MGTPSSGPRPGLVGRGRHRHENLRPQCLPGVTRPVWAPRETAAPPGVPSLPLILPGCKAPGGIPLALLYFSVLKGTCPDVSDRTRKARWGGGTAGQVRPAEAAL